MYLQKIISKNNFEFFFVGILSASDEKSKIWIWNLELEPDPDPQHC
jgi:hypothetical protein